MDNNTDVAAVIRALDSTLMEEARRWRSLMSAYDDEGETRGVDWAEEFCVVVRNRLEKLRRQQARSRF